ncbi:MAG: glutamyl-tRNA reductase [Roseiflexaceae bacterium]
MQLIITGVHQRTTPILLRERLAFPAPTLPAALDALREVVGEGLILSTCNRVEVYGLVGSEDHDEQALRRFFAGYKDLPLDDLTPHTFTYTGADAVRHLFRLAAGLDSMVLGEDQIMGQLKAATAAAEEHGLLGQMLHRLTQSALAAGKLVRSQTGIGRARLSVVSVALDLARSTLGSLSGQRVLIVGAGRMAELALKHLEDERPLAVGIINRTAERAQALAERYGATAWMCDELEQALRCHDVVICCTAAPNVVIEAPLAERVSAGRVTPLLLLDLAVPRDVAREVAALPNVRLFDVDDMQAISAENRAARAAEISRAEALIEDEVTKFMEWWATQQVVPTIRALRERAEAIRAAELERALSRLPNLSEREQAAISALSAAIVNKLLHQPIATLKNPEGGGELAQAVQRLFQL